MMTDDQGCYIIIGVMVVIGAVIGFALWAFRLIPAWGIAVGALGVPAAAIIVLVILLLIGKG